MIEYPPHIASLSRDYYYHRISAEVYREERRKIIQDMERLHNRDSIHEVNAENAKCSGSELP